jgi:hypothetical protein
MDRTGCAAKFVLFFGMGGVGRDVWNTDLAATADTTDGRVGQEPRPSSFVRISSHIFRVKSAQKIRVKSARNTLRKKTLQNLQEKMPGSARLNPNFATPYLFIPAAQPHNPITPQPRNLATL